LYYIVPDVITFWATLYVIMIYMISLDNRTFVLAICTILRIFVVKRPHYIICMQCCVNNVTCTQWRCGRIYTMRLLYDSHTTTISRTWGTTHDKTRSYLYWSRTSRNQLIPCRKISQGRRNELVAQSYRGRMCRSIDVSIKTDPSSTKVLKSTLMIQRRCGQCRDQHFNLLFKYYCQ